ncbi:MAG: pyridoxal-phosphate dependent enzyme [Alistipes senegalensis]|nr:pyridoxal-phosphate dependent enzyme [Oxalobacter formigenes]MCM1280649.1 pyridoxal-phosphate dependent enzyme [Alistipes senegalensis]
MTVLRNFSRQFEEAIGNTPLAPLVRLPGKAGGLRNNVVLAKLEGSNPSGSLKDRAMYAMVHYAQERGVIRPGDRLIEATNGNSGIALAMIAARKGYRCKLVMPESTSREKQQCMAAYGAEIALTPALSGMAFARRLVDKMVKEGLGVTLNQYANPDNPRAHYETTGPEIWQATDGRVTHVVGAMGTTGTLMGIARFLKEKNSGVQVIGVEPAGRIPGMQKWSDDAMPEIFDGRLLDRIMLVSQASAEYMARRLALEEGLFCGLSSAAACQAALQLAAGEENATIVFIAGDRGDRYLSMGFFPA